MDEEEVVIVEAPRCPICLDDVTIGGAKAKRAVTLHDKHFVCAACIIQIRNDADESEWIKCPLCRKVLMIHGKKKPPSVLSFPPSTRVIVVDYELELRPLEEEEEQQAEDDTEWIEEANEWLRRRTERQRQRQQIRELYIRREVIASSMREHPDDEHYRSMHELLTVELALLLADGELF